MRSRTITPWFPLRRSSLVKKVIKFDNLPMPGANLHQSVPIIPMIRQLSVLSALYWEGVLVYRHAEVADIKSSGGIVVG